MIPIAIYMIALYIITRSASVLVGTAQATKGESAFVRILAFLTLLVATGGAVLIYFAEASLRAGLGM